MFLDEKKFKLFIFMGHPVFLPFLNTIIILIPTQSLKISVLKCNQDFLEKNAIKAISILCRPGRGRRAD